MTVRECYQQIGADYSEIVDRLGSEGLVKRFALKFPADSSFANLKEALANQDAETAFRAAHTLKGVCTNLGFTQLYEASSELTEKLRGRELNGYEEFFSKVEQEYHKTIDALSKVE